MKTLQRARHDGNPGCERRRRAKHFRLGSRQRRALRCRSSDAGQEASREAAAKPRGSSAFATAPRSRAVNAFDGDWSVLIQTRDGNCDPAYRYGVQIQNGEILNGGSAPVTVEGRVAPSGAVQVSVSAGSQEAHGAGRLSRTSGMGTWRGQGRSAPAPVPGWRSGASSRLLPRVPARRDIESWSV